MKRSLPDFANQASPARPLPPPAAETTVSKTTAALPTLSKEDALATWARLKDGYRDKSGAGCAPAVLHPNGCLVAQKTANREQNGYVQIAPVVTTRTRARKGEEKKTKPEPQGGHRLAVVAHHGDDDVENLLQRGWHASHRCGRPKCIEPRHICVEPRDANEARKQYRDSLTVIKTVIEGKKFLLPPPRACPCDPPCVTHTEVRVAKISE